LIYENEKTLNDEREGISLAAEKWGAKPVKLPRKYSIDFAMVKDGGVKAWVEFKKRTNPIMKYPSYMVSLFKYMNLVSMAEKTGAVGMFVVQWTDCIGYVTVPVQHDVIFSGRQDRGDWEDMEPMVSIPIDAFKLL